MLNDHLANLPSETKIPSILVVGCGRVGSSIVKKYVDSVAPGSCEIFVTDSDKERARKLSEYRLSMITPIRWRHAHETPLEADLIVVAVDRSSEEKIIDRLALSKKPFISLSDNATVFDSYVDYEEEFRQSGVLGVVGTGLVPGAGNVLVQHCAKQFDVVHDIIVDRLGFVSASSLDSIKDARKDSPLVIRDGIPTDSRRDGGSALSWFPPPYDLVECQSVASAVAGLAASFPGAHNISVRFTEPKLPTFSERVRNIFLKVPLTTNRACIRVELHGLIDGQMQTKVLAMVGDALNIITSTTILAMIGLHNFDNQTQDRYPFLDSTDVIDTKDLLNILDSSGMILYSFEGNGN